MSHLNHARLVTLRGVLLVLLLTLFVGGCASWDRRDPTKGWSAEQLYSGAKELLDLGDYEKAIDYYGKLNVRYPIGTLAQQGMLDIAYAYYKYNKPPKAITAINRFIELHPRHENVDYAYYLKGLVYDTGKQSFLYKLTDRSSQDTTSILAAFRAFSSLVNRFPHSRYADHARNRMRVLRNTVARNELNIARFYYDHGAYIAAVNRSQSILKNYQRTIAIPDALVVLAKSYQKLKLFDQYTDMVRLISLNYPDQLSELKVNL